MMDSTQVVFANSQIDKIISAIERTNKDILSPGTVAIIAALIGILAALLPQWIAHMLQRRKEKKGLSRELVAEYKRLYILLVEYINEYVFYAIESRLWYAAGETKEARANPQWNNIYYQKFHELTEKKYQAINKITNTKAEYFKIFSIYGNIVKVPFELKELLDKFKKASLSDAETAQIRGDDFYNLRQSASMERRKLLAENQQVLDTLEQIDKLMDN